MMRALESEQLETRRGERGERRDEADDDGGEEVVHLSTQKTFH
jgi:hypothetical protein